MMTFIYYTMNNLFENNIIKNLLLVNNPRLMLFVLAPLLTFLFFRFDIYVLFRFLKVLYSYICRFFVLLRSLFMYFFNCINIHHNHHSHYNHHIDHITNNTECTDRNTELNNKLSQLISNLENKISNINSYEKKINDLATELEFVKKTCLTHTNIINNLNTTTNVDHNYDKLKSDITDHINMELNKYRKSINTLRQIAIAPHGGYMQ